MEEGSLLGTRSLRCGFKQELSVVANSGTKGCTHNLLINHKRGTVTLL